METYGIVTVGLYPFVAWRRQQFIALVGQSNGKLESFVSLQLCKYWCYRQLFRGMAAHLVVCVPCHTLVAADISNWYFETTLPSSHHQPSIPFRPYLSTRSEMIMAHWILWRISYTTRCRWFSTIQSLMCTSRSCFQPNDWGGALILDISKKYLLAHGPFNMGIWALCRYDHLWSKAGRPHGNETNALSKTLSMLAINANASLIIWNFWGKCNRNLADIETLPKIFPIMYSWFPVCTSLD